MDNLQQSKVLNACCDEKHTSFPKKKKKCCLLKAITFTVIIITTAGAIVFLLYNYINVHNKIQIINSEIKSLKLSLQNLQLKCDNIQNNGTPVELQNDLNGFDGDILKRRKRGADGNEDVDIVSRERQNFKNPKGKKNSRKDRRGKDNNKRRKNRRKNKKGRSKKVVFNKNEETKIKEIVKEERVKHASTEAVHMQIDTSRSEPSNPELKTKKSGSIVDYWKKSDSDFNFFQSFADYNANNGTVTIKKAGLYYIYSQMTYYDRSGRWSHTVDINGDSFIKCLGSEWGLEVDPETSLYFNTVYQCHTAAVNYISQGSQVSIKSMYADRVIHADKDMTYWGIIKLN